MHMARAEKEDKDRLKMQGTTRSDSGQNFKAKAFPGSQIFQSSQMSRQSSKGNLRTTMNSEANKTIGSNYNSQHMRANSGDKRSKSKRKYSAARPRRQAKQSS
jgi:hypothetical protein